MKKRICDIASIQTGIYAKPDPVGEVLYIMGRHFNSDKKIDPAIQPELQLNDKTKKHLLRTGDILVASKGYNLFSIVFHPLKYPAVASSMFIILKLHDPQIILPEYLAWHLNHPKTQKILSGSSKGTALRSITKDIIGNLEIPIPPVQKQRALLNAMSLLAREAQLKSKIENLKNSIIQHQLLSVISEKYEW
ncbi:MAG: restriction endonuclease subunit S [Bacteroidales bacterium]|jgi:restriction endonuclease S subunit|nr:restriction endonuclease subunit S [Bacteroidales bacterium]